MSFWAAVSIGPLERDFSRRLTSYRTLRSRPMPRTHVLRHLAGMAKDHVVGGWAPDRAASALSALRSFIVGVLRDFRANQGLLLAGAVAYYALLSLVPMLVLVVIALAYVMDSQLLVATITEYLDFIVPGYAETVAEQLRLVLAHQDLIGGVLLVSMLFFSSLAFTVKTTMDALVQPELRRFGELRQLHRRIRSGGLVLIVLEKGVRVLPRLGPDPVQPHLEGLLAVVRSAEPEISPCRGGHQG